MEPPKPLVTRVISTWSDMLGFGSCLDKLNWDLTIEESTNKTVNRLDMFRKSVTKQGSPEVTCFALNDGIGMTYDLPKEEPIHLPTMWGYFMQFAGFHNHLNKIDKEAGYPGIRSVWAAGHRLVDSSWREGFSRKVSGQDTEPPSRPWSGFRTPPTKEKKRIATYTPREFQLNLALAKAYTLDDLGSKGGLEGPHLFVDESFMSTILLKFDHTCRSLPDVWGYRTKKLGSGKSITVALEKKCNYGESFETTGLLKLEVIRKNKKVRWGNTNIYKLLYAENNQIPYKVSLI